MALAQGIGCEGSREGLEELSNQLPHPIHEREDPHSGSKGSKYQSYHECNLINFMNVYVLSSTMLVMNLDPSLSLSIAVELLADFLIERGFF